MYSEPWYSDIRMPETDAVLDGSWKEVRPLSDYEKELYEKEIAWYLSKYPSAKIEKAEEWAIERYFTEERKSDGLLQKLFKKEDGTLIYKVKMEYTSKQKEFYEWICTK